LDGDPEKFVSTPSCSLFIFVVRVRDGFSSLFLFDVRIDALARLEEGLRVAALVGGCRLTATLMTFTGLALNSLGLALLAWLFWRMAGLLDTSQKHCKTIPKVP
jgi:hypothetical protein